MKGGNISIALVSRSNALGGGASRIAEELASWLIDAGYCVRHYCANPIGLLRNFQSPLHSLEWLRKLSRTIDRVTRWLGIGERIPFEFFSKLRSVVSECNIVHFHDLATAISPMTLHLCSKRKPVVFTAHDCSSFTGGCIYPLGCERYFRKCGKCPQLARMGARFDRTASNLARNRFIAKTREIQYVFPSNWLKESASRSLTFGRPAEVIPYGFASEPYKFRSRSNARRELGLAEDQRIVIVAAHFLGDPRKGLDNALAALQAIADVDPLVIFVGVAPSDIEVRVPRVRFWLTGFVREREKLGLLFAAADVFLFCSVEDNLPIMVQEAMAAGTPIVGFAAGGVREMVEDQRTGWLCAPGNQTGLNGMLRMALLGEEREAFGAAAQQAMRERFSVESFVQQHVEIYKKMITES
jgi:glycosyltransferase involved in cell wall biosynthesis